MFTYLATLTGAKFIAAMLLLFLLVAGTTHGLFKVTEWWTRARHSS